MLQRLLRVVVEERVEVRLEQDVTSRG